MHGCPILIPSVWISRRDKAYKETRIWGHAQEKKDVRRLSETSRPGQGPVRRAPRRALHAAAGLADADGRERAMLSRLPTTYAGTLCSRREGWHSDPLRSRGGP